MLYVIGIITSAVIAIGVWLFSTYCHQRQEHALLYVPVKQESKEESLDK